jgi:hypothetical protein
MTFVTRRKRLETEWLRVISEAEDHLVFVDLLVGDFQGAAL